MKSFFLHRAVILLITAFIVFCSLSSCSNIKTITILYTNDIHADFLPHGAPWVKEKSKPLIGGFNEFYFAVDSIRKVKPSILMLDAGDVMTGNPITEYIYAGAYGGALIAMMNGIGYDAWTFGNHEFDITHDNLRKLAAIAEFPAVSANILDTLENFPLNNREYIIIEKEGVKIGIIGAMSGEFYKLVKKSSSEGINILPPVETIRRIARQLYPQTDLLIALTHQGIDDDLILAENVPELDVIVGGHSHTQLTKPRYVNGVIIVQTGSHCENLGVLDIEFEDHNIVSFNGSLLPLWYNSERKQTKLSVFIDSVKNQLDKDYSEIIGVLKEDWIRRNDESGIGNFITDAQREAAGADIGFMNTYGIRKDLTAGPITKQDLFEIMPFHNTLMKFELTGSQVRSIVEFYINKHARIQTSGINCEWRRKPDGSIKFTSFIINGKALDENKKYICAASDYMIGTAMDYFGIEIPDAVPVDLTVFSAVENKIKNMKEIRSRVEGRIRKAK
ncbi:MAG: bifunctional metallophosphatase/5'-nucleotidase [Bacteroidetes bacterium]|nr:bifunctional metallophosphatase/5'-nucleotidase [Bacteroidota bacterium]